MRRVDAIRKLFLEFRPQYSVREAAALLGWNRRKLAEEIAASELASVDVNGFVSWDAVATIAVTEWSAEAIEEALGSDATVLPELCRLANVHLRLPRYQIIALEAAARREHASASEFLSRYLLDQTCNEAPALLQTVPGFREAFTWPRSDRRESENAA